MDKQLTQEEIEVNLLLERFFVQVSEMPIIEQVKIFKDI